MEKRELEFSTRLTREDVAGLVEALIEGLKDGHLRVQKSDEVLELEVPRVVDLEIEAKIDDERAEFEIEVSWRTNRAENPDNAPDAEPAPVKRTAGAGRSRSAESGTRAAEARKTVRKTAVPGEVEPPLSPAGKKIKKATGRAAVSVARRSEAAAGVAPASGAQKKSGRKSAGRLAGSPDAAGSSSED